MDEKVRFYEKGSGQSLYFAEDGEYMVLSHREKAVDSDKKEHPTK